MKHRPEVRQDAEGNWEMFCPCGVVIHECVDQEHAIEEAQAHEEQNG